MVKSSFKIIAIVALVAAGVVLFVMSSSPKKSEPEAVLLTEIFPKPAANAKGPAASAQPPAVERRDPVPSPAIVINTPIGASEGFAVQVYSFQDKTRAQASLAGLQSKGFTAYIVASDLGEKGLWYRVRVGGLNTEQDAQKMLVRIREEYKSGFIVKPKK